MKAKKSKRYTINGLDEATARKIKVLAAQRGVTIPVLINSLIEAATQTEGQ